MSITTEANDVYRNFETDGVVSSGEHFPRKPEIRALFSMIDAAYSSLGLGLTIGNAIFKTTLSSLNSDLLHGAGTIGVVYADGTAANNGIFIKSGSSGSGSWGNTNITLPATFASDIAALMADKQDQYDTLDKLGIATVGNNQLLSTDSSGDFTARDISGYGIKFLNWIPANDAQDKFPYVTSGNSIAASSITSQGRALVGQVSYGDMRSLLSLVVGTDVQAFHANLAQLAGLSLSTNKILYVDGSGNLAVGDLTSAGRALLDDANSDAQLSTLGLSANAIAFVKAANYAAMKSALSLSKADVGLNLVDNVSATDLRDRSTHTGTQTADTITDGTTNKVFTGTEKTKLANIEANANVTNATSVGSAINGSSEKTVPVDADFIPLVDSAASNVLKKLSWSNLKIRLKAFFDTVYATIKDSVQTQGRPGDAIGRFTSTLTGSGELGTVPTGSIVTSSRGSILRQTGASVTALRERTAINPTAKYVINFAVTRNTDPTDPAGDTVRFGVQWLLNNKNSNGQLTDETLDYVLFIVDGRKEARIVIGPDDSVEGVDFEWPAGTIYFTPFVQTFGLDGVTDIELIQSTDITEIQNFSVDISEAVSAELATKQDADSFLTSLSGNVTVPIALGGTAATTAVGGADNLSTIGDDIVAAATTEIGASTGNMVTVTGSTGISSWGTTGATGIERTVRFSGSPLLTHGSILLPGSQNIQVNPSDIGVFRKAGGSTWRCISWQPYLPELSTVTTRTGASDENHPIGADSDGRMSYTFLPSGFKFLTDEGQYGIVGDGLRNAVGISDDGKFELLGPWPKLINDLAKRPRTQPIVYLAGDSRADGCTFENTVTEARGFLWWLGFLTGWKFDFENANNYGVGGSTTDVLIDQALQLITKPPGIVIIIDQTNDRTSTTNVITHERTIIQLEAVERLLTLVGGHIVIWINDTPRGDGNPWNGSGSDFHPGLTDNGRRGDHLRLAQWFRERQKNKNVYCADTWPTMCNPTDSMSRAIDTVFYDGLHPGAPGGYLIAQAIRPILDDILPYRPRLPSSNYDRYSGTNTSGNLIDNGMMVGTSGTVNSPATGTLADGWTVDCGASLVATCSKLAIGDGTFLQEVSLIGTPSGASSGVQPNLLVDPVSAVFSYALDTSDLAEGDVVEAVCYAAYDGADGSYTGLRGIPLYIEWTASGVDNFVVGGEPNMANNADWPNLRLPPLNLNGIQMTPRWTVPASLTAAKVSFKVVARNSEAVNATVRFGKVGVRKVIDNG